MKHPKYDSPFVLNVSDITTQIARNTDEMCWQAIQRVGIDVDKDKLLAALNRDSERYREAYKNGYATGYETRDEEIIKCKDCKHGKKHNIDIIECMKAVDYNLEPREFHHKNWFCADGERRNDDA